MKNDKKTGSEKKRLSRVAAAFLAFLLVLGLTAVILPAAYAEGEDGAPPAETVAPEEPQPSETLAAEEPQPDEPAMKTTKVNGHECVDGEIIVKFKDSVTGAKMAGALAAADSSIQQELPVDNVVVTEVPEGETVESFIKTMESRPEVEYAQPNYIYHVDMAVNDPYASPGYQWHLRTIGAFDAWDITMGSSSIKVAVVDTGIDLDHPDLVGKIYAQYDYVHGDRVAQDDNGHGTHVAGIIAATANNGKGVAGVAPGVKLIAVKAFDSDGNATSLNCAYGIYYAANHGADVINMSFGYYGEDYTIENAVSYAANEENEIICVAAAGNGDEDGSPRSGFISPGDYEQCISVMATDIDDIRASYSDYGPRKDICAPGQFIYSTYNPATDSYYYGMMSGTSMASPVVAGVAALILSANPDLTIDQVKDILYSTALDLGDEGKDDDYGYGRVIAARAVYKAANMSMFAGGTGTEGDPYLVSTPEQLNAVRYYPDANFKMTCDIDLSAATSSGGKYYYSGLGWYPIDVLNGSFDGQGYIINGLNITDADADCVGLFDYINDGGEVSNVNITNGYILGERYVGSIAGLNYGTITNCSSDADITSDYYCVGGITGYNEGNISYCDNSGTITGGANDVGGIAGECDYGTIIYCTNSADINAYMTVGGIAGNLEGTVSWCSNSGHIQSEFSNAGGIAGYIYDMDTGYGRVQASYNTGTITSVNDIGPDRAGGIAGYCISGLITDCFNTGIIEADDQAGGIAGYGGEVVYNCYNIGNKGILGFGYSYLLPENCYYLNLGESISYGGTSRTEEQMLQQASYNEYDFTYVWQIDEGKRFPTLRLTPFASVTEVSLPETLKIKIGHSAVLTPVFTPENAVIKDVTWESSDPSVASVSDGAVTMMGDGTATITVTTRDGKLTDTCEITLLHEYTINADPNNAAYGSVTGGGIRDEDTAVTLTAIPNDGYRFLRWTEDGGEISTSPVLTFTATENRTLTAEFTQIDTPSILSIAAPDYDRAALSWSPVEGSGGYEVWRSTSAAGTYSIINTLTDTSYTNTNLKAGTTYYYKIRAYCVAGSVTTYGSLSGYASVRPVPLAPASCSASEVDYDSIRVEWSPVNGASGYLVYRAAGGGEYTRVATTSKIYYVNNYVDTGTTYSYKVCAYRSSTGIYGDYSPDATAATRLEPMENVTAVMYNPTTNKISWDTVAGASGYKVYRSDSETGDYDYIGSKSYRYAYYYDNYLEPNKTYYYKVRAYRSLSGGEYEGDLSVFTSATPIYDAVKQINAAAYSSTSSKIIWGAVPGSTGYDVYRCNSDGSDAVLLTTSSKAYTSTYYYDKNLAPNDTYSYFVRAYATYKDGEESKEYVTADSDIKSAMPTLGDVTDAKAVQYKLTSVKISWNSVAGKSGYEVQMFDDADNPIGDPRRTSRTYYTWTGLIYGKGYHFKVRAYVNYTGGRGYSQNYSNVAILEAGLKPVPKLKAAAYSAARVKLTWGSVPYKSGYAVMFCDEDGNKLPDTQIATTSKTYYYHGDLTPEKEYYYKVCAYRGADDYGPWSDVVSATPVLARVTGESGYAYNTTTNKISWSKVWGCTGYEIYRSDTEDGEYNCIGYRSNRYTYYYDKSLAGGATYYYKVRAYVQHTDGTKKYSDYSGIVEVMAGLKPVRGAKAAMYNPTQVKLTWKSVSYASGYEISFCDPDGGPIGKDSVTTTRTYYYDKNLTRNMTYNYKVRAYRGSGESIVYGPYTELSAALTFSTPENVKAEPYTLTSVRISWSAVAGRSGYRVQRCDAAGNEIAGEYRTTKSTYYTWTGLTSGDEYHFKVCAYEKGTGYIYYTDYSNPVSSAKPGLKKVTGAKAAPYNLTTVKLTWKSVPYRTYYEIWLCDSEGEEQSIAGTTGSTYYYMKGLTPGTTYHYRVRAYRTGGLYGEYSDPLTAELPEFKPPVIVNAEPYNLTTVRISWSKVWGASGYEVHRYNPGTGEYELLKATSGTYYNDKYHKLGDSFNYKVLAYSGSKKTGLSDATAVGGPGLKQVTKPKAARAGVMKVKVSWRSVSYKTGYEILRCDTEDGDYVKVGTTTRTYYYDNWGNTGHTYYYKIRAYRISGGVTYYGELSNAVSATA